MSNNQAWVGNGGQIGKSTMMDIQGRSQEANHKKSKPEKKQGGRIESRWKQESWSGKNKS